MERFSRELVSSIQKLRKDSGLDVVDRIKLTITSNDSFVKESLNIHDDYVKNETLFGITCPLTSIENSLRGINHSKSFIAYWIKQIIYWDFPTQFFLILFCVFLGWTFLIWKLCPPNAKCAD